MARLLSETGQFNIYTDAEHLETDKLAKRGGIYLRNGHALTVLEDGSSVVSPVTGPYILALGSVNVRVAAGVGNKIIATTRKGDKLPYLGEVDWDTGWFKVETKSGIGYITNKTRYVRLVE